MSSAAELLQPFPLFERLPPDAAGKLLQGHYLRPLEAGSVVIAQGEKAPRLNCVISGLVKLVVPGGRQKERIIDLIGPGKCFCMASIFLDLPCPVTAIVLEPGQTLVLQRQSVLDATAACTPLALRVIGRVSWQLCQMIHEAQSDSEDSSAKRVLHWLLSHQESTITLRFNKKTIAASLNLAPETFSRVLRDLRTKGLIDVTREEIEVVDRARLATLETNLLGNRSPGR